MLSANHQTRPSARLALYGLAFRTLRRMIVHGPAPGGQESAPVLPGPRPRGLEWEPVPGSQPGPERG